MTEPITIAEELARKWETEAREKQAERDERRSGTLSADDILDAIERELDTPRKITENRRQTDRPTTAEALDILSRPAPERPVNAPIYPKHEEPRTIRMRLGTTTYQVADVPWEEATDPDANWEAWDWKPHDRTPDYFIMPLRKEPS